ASSTALITWNSNEPADSQVEYGLTASYGNTTPLAPQFVTAHGVGLTGLQANTLYHYRVLSKDASGNLATSADFTFTTSASGGVLFSDNFNVATLDLNKWSRGNNSGNQAAIANNALELRSQGSQSGWVITKQAFVAQNTIVAVKVVQPNNDGDLGMTPTFNLGSGNGIFDQSNWYRFYVYRNQASGPYLLYAQWSKAGAVNGLDVTGNLVINGAVYLRLRCDAAQIYFEASLDGVSWMTAYSEPFALPGYSLSNAFYYELAAYKSSINGVCTVDDFSITGSNSAAAELASASSFAAAPAAMPSDFALSQNYPNPFSRNSGAATRMNLALPQPGRVRAVIYNLQGQEVKRLHESTFAAGSHVLQWNGANEEGEAVSSGAYLLRVIFEGESAERAVMTRRIILMK
ncbi:T9SS type A sorting domain-containing protein, partial [candidate division KSB1 bacterium]|nr:T9SS type A sorting domain-containing protein [candidate division KSB1 bacterium]